MSGTGLLSAAFALLAPGDIRAFAGFVYFILPLAMPWNAVHFTRRAGAAEEGTTDMDRHV